MYALINNSGLINIGIREHSSCVAFIWFQYFWFLTWVRVLLPFLSLPQLGSLSIFISIAPKPKAVFAMLLRITAWTNACRPILDGRHPH